VIELDAVTKRRGAREAVRALSLAIAEGELLALVGGSGSGKTTTLELVNRLLEPDAGTVRIGGRDIQERAPAELRRTIGYVFQGVGLFPHLSVGRNVGITCELLGWEPARIRARVSALLDAMELDPALAEALPSALSGGQAQRVAVARALAAEPPVLLFDEPFGAVDPPTRDRLQALVERRKGSFTGLFVTHDLSEALRLGDRIAVLHEGALQQVATPDELLASPATDAVRAFVEVGRATAARYRGRE
jgi:osmoprotectant transport system ATP-binding protein